MGISNSLVAVRGLAPSKALDLLGMEVAEVTSPDATDFSATLMAELPDDWLLLIVEFDDDAFENQLRPFTELGTAVAWHINENVMYSEARGYEAGEEVWRVVHDPDQDEGVYALSTDGNPPPQLRAIHAAARAEQDADGEENAGVDYIFDVPANLARSICGYSIAEPEPEGLRYARLRKIGAVDPEPRRGFFARLFGR